MKDRLKIIIENIVIVLSIFSLWPLIFGYQALWYKISLYGLAFILVFIAVKRIRRFKITLILLALISGFIFIHGVFHYVVKGNFYSRTPKSNLAFYREIETAQVYFQEDNLGLAQAHWEKALALNPQAIDLYHKIGIIYLKKKMFARAGEIYQAGLKVSPQNTDFYYHLALAYLGENKYSLCLKNLEKLLSINPYYPRAHYIKGIVYEETGDEERAHKEFIAELNNDPGSVLAWHKVKGKK